jgi:anti-anti-sigma factor
VGQSNFSELRLNQNRIVSTEIVRVSGEIDMSNSAELYDVLQDAIYDEETSSVLADLHDVSFIDCRGLSSLIMANNVAIEQQKEFGLWRPSRCARRLLVLADMEDVINVYYPDSH